MKNVGGKNCGCEDLTSIVVGAAEERFGKTTKQGEEQNCGGLDGLMVY